MRASALARRLALNGIDVDRSQPAQPQHVHGEPPADPVAVETDRAVALGLIVNELVTNALKYAYPAGRPGEVRVSFGQRDGAGLALVVEDDGAGYPADGAAPQGSGLGNVIVSAMARTARGTVTRDPAHQGTRFVLSLDA